MDVIIVGCGPTGAMLAAELRLHDVRVLVLEKETEPKSFVRIVGLHIRSIELMAMRGLLDRILEHGRQRPAGGFFAAITKPAPEGLDSAHAYLLGIPQPVIEHLLEDHAIELGAQVRRGCAVVGFEPAKISVAMTKAFLAVNGSQGAASARIRELVAGLTEAVVGALIRRQPQGGTFHIGNTRAGSHDSSTIHFAIRRSGSIASCGIAIATWQA